MFLFLTSITLKVRLKSVFHINSAKVIIFFTKTYQVNEKKIPRERSNGSVGIIFSSGSENGFTTSLIPQHNFL